MGRVCRAMGLFVVCTAAAMSVYCQEAAKSQSTDPAKVDNRVTKQVTFFQLRVSVSIVTSKVRLVHGGWPEQD